MTRLVLDLAGGGAALRLHIVLRRVVQDATDAVLEQVVHGGLDVLLVLPCPPPRPRRTQTALQSLGYHNCRGVGGLSASPASAAGSAGGYVSSLVLNCALHMFFVSCMQATCRGSRYGEGTGMGKEGGLLAPPQKCRKKVRFTTLLTRIFPKTILRRFNTVSAYFTSGLIEHICADRGHATFTAKRSHVRNAPPR